MKLLIHTSIICLSYFLTLLFHPLYGNNCDASFGTLAEAAVCISDDQAIISSNVLADSGEHIPDGFARLFVLTSGPDLIIEAVSAAPEFIVTTDADYRIHSLIYDPATLDLSSIVFGETSAVAVNSLLLQGGGDICAVLDVAGAHFNVEDCPCEAEVGILKTSNDPCLEDSDVLIDFEELTAPIIPEDYEVIYVLTSGNDLIIEQVSYRNRIYRE